MASVRAGVGREVAHEAIKEHAVAVALEMREQGSEGNDLINRLAADPRLGLDLDALNAALGSPIEFVGNAVPQTAAFVLAVEQLAAKYPEAAQYQGEEIL